jgi:ribosomal protein S18 acetylase RimI-like enzyme
VTPFIQIGCYNFCVPEKTIRGVIMLTFKNIVSQDDDFLFNLYANIRKAEFLDLGWQEEQLEAFLRMQYEAQKKSYLLQFPSATYEMVMINDVRIGRIITCLTDSTIDIVDISLLSEYRNRGIGTNMIEMEKKKALATNKCIRLHVLQSNPARRLYERLGFHIKDEPFPYYKMEWVPKRGVLQ